MNEVISALRKSHRYFRALSLADPGNARLLALYREVGSALAAIITPAPVADHNLN